MRTPLVWSMALMLALTLIVAAVPVAKAQVVGTEVEVPEDAVEAYFVDIVDGDTFEAEILDEDGRVEDVTVRLIGIDTPETSYSFGNEPECYGEEAKQRAEGLLLYAEEIWLEADRDPEDDFDRLLRYVYFRHNVDHKVYMLNEVLVREGYALAKDYRPNLAHQDELDRAERRAIENANGMWLTCDASVSMDPDQERDEEPDDRPAPTPEGGVVVEEDAACAIFDNQADAQDFLDEYPEIAEDIDIDGDGEACEDWFD